MKKIFGIIILSLLFALCVMGLVACGDTGANGSGSGIDNNIGQSGSGNGQSSSENNDAISGGNISQQPPHTHNYYITVIEPTCTEQGYTKHTCECGESYNDNYINSLGHEFQESITKTATCVEQGKKHFECVNCDYSYDQEYSLEKFESTELYNYIEQSVVEIITYDRNGDALSLGSGFIYKSNGLIVTNYHVIEEAWTAKVNVSGIKYNVVNVQGYDKLIDIAILKINASNLNELTVCSKPIQTGSTVYAFGSSKGLTATFSNGMVTHAEREEDGVKYIQHNAAISSGNSGGPLINEYGEVIGVNTFTIRDSQNLNFAVKVEEIENLANTQTFTLKQIYEREVDVLKIIGQYIQANGTYYSDSKYYRMALGHFYSDDGDTRFDRIAYYYVETGKIDISVYITDGTLGGIYYDPTSQSFKWSYIDGYDNFMMGNIYPSTFTKTTTLTYTYSTFTDYSSQKTSLALMSTMAAYICSCFNSDFADVGVTLEDIGFTAYR